MVQSWLVAFVATHCCLAAAPANKFLGFVMSFWWQTFKTVVASVNAGGGLVAVAGTHISTNIDTQLFKRIARLTPMNPGCMLLMSVPEIRLTSDLGSGKT